MAGAERCHQIFSVNYGLAQYVDRTVHRANEARAANPIQYAYLKDVAYAAEQELRVTLSAMGMGQFVLADGRQLAFPPSLQLEFDFRGAIADGTITQVLTGATTDVAGLEGAIRQLNAIPGIARTRTTVVLSTKFEDRVPASEEPEAADGAE